MSAHTSSPVRRKERSIEFCPKLLGRFCSPRRPGRGPCASEDSKLSTCLCPKVGARLAQDVMMEEL